MVPPGHKNKWRSATGMATRPLHRAMHRGIDQPEAATDTAGRADAIVPAGSTLFPRRVRAGRSTKNGV